MQRLDGHELGAWSLRLDAVYCALLGVIVTFGGGFIAPQFALPATALIMIGLAAVVWAGCVWWMHARLPPRRALRCVMTANILAASGVALGSMLSTTTPATVVVIVIAFQIALFAASQAAALHTLARCPRGERTALPRRDRDG